MKNKMMVCFLLGSLLISFTESHNILEKVWLNGDKSAKIQIYKSGNYYNGKIVWLKEPKDIHGNDKTDIHNPNEKERNNPALGLVVLKGLVEGEKNVFTKGTIYDPKNGKTYSCKITIKDPSNIEVRGFIGFSLIGRTEHWTIAP